MVFAQQRNIGEHSELTIRSEAGQVIANNRYKVENRKTTVSYRVSRTIKQVRRPS